MLLCNSLTTIKLYSGYQENYRNARYMQCQLSNSWFPAFRNAKYRSRSYRNVLRRRNGLRTFLTQWTAPLRSHRLNVIVALIRDAEKIEVVSICLSSSASAVQGRCGVCGCLKSTQHFFCCAKLLCCVTKCWKSAVIGWLSPQHGHETTKYPVRHKMEIDDCPVQLSI